MIKIEYDDKKVKKNEIILLSEAVQKIIVDVSYTNGGHSLEPPKSVKSYENIFVAEYQVWD